MGASSVRSTLIAGVLGSVLCGVCSVSSVQLVSAQTVAARTQPERADKAATVTLNVKGVELETVLQMISRQAGLKLYVPGKGVPQSVRVTMQVRDMVASDAFAKALTGTGLQALIVSGTVLLSDVGGKGTATAQGSIAGKVVDGKTKQPLRGATITVDDNAKGTTSRDDGQFRLASVTPGQHTVHIRLLGYAKSAKIVTVVEGQTTTVDVALDASVSALDQVIVTGTIVATAQRAVPNAMTVITAKDIEQRGITQIQQLFRGDVPGLFAINFGSGDPLDTVSMFSRGATRMQNTNQSASTNPIKTYVDGVELANPAYLSQIDPRSIERIEILTGPQASTIYGSNAINGVMQVFTKRGSGAQRPQLTATLLSGLVQNNYSPSYAPQHDYSAQVNGTEGRWSYNAGGSWQYMAPWTPSKQTSVLSGFGGARMQIGAFTADGSLRLSGTQNNQAGSASQPTTEYIENGWYKPTASKGLSKPTTSLLNGQTLGITLSYAPASWWSHEFVMGTDQSQTETRVTGRGYTSPRDTILSYFQGTNRRMSLRYATTARVPVTSQAQLTVTLGADGWHNLQSSLSVSPTVLTGSLTSVAPYSTNLMRQPEHNAGGFLQAQLGFHDALFLTYGLRAEWNPNYGADAVPNYAPRFGAAYTRDIETPWGQLTAKVRGSYGRSTRPPVTGQKAAQTFQDYFNSIGATTTADYTAVYGVFYETFANPELAPEIQQGGEGGLELYFGNRGSLVVTRYNQTVDQLIDQVLVDSSRSLLPCVPGQFGCYSPIDGGYGYMYQYENLNVGSIRNQGWEAQGSLTVGPLTTRGTYSWTNSKVIGVNEKYRFWLNGSQYQKGAMFSWLPDHTWAWSMTYAQAGTSIGLNVNGVGRVYMDGWEDELFERSINSTIRLTANQASTQETRLVHPGGNYATADLNATHRFTGAIEGVLQVQNLTDYYKNDFRAYYATMGRQTKAGLRIRL